MPTIDALLFDLFADNAAGFASLTLTEARPENTRTRKITARPVVIKGDVRVQFELFQTDNKAVHQNVPPSDAPNLVQNWLVTYFKQGLFRAADGTEYHVTHDKGNRPHIRTTKQNTGAGKETFPAAPLPLPVHNRRKNHLLDAESGPIPFLVHLGVQTRAGDVKAGRYDKFKQINRFLEMVDDVVKFLPTNGPLHIVDFGCGKSYLTFALHHYLTAIKKRDVQIVGLDLKADVVAHCNTVAGDLSISPDALRFTVGDIAGQGSGLFAGGQVHMVVSLHACDTATDDALVQAMQWNAPVILSVPCCQHELNGKIENAALRPLLKHGLLKERTASLVTDALRAQVLEIAGYDVQVLEFIDMEHTPKNLLLRSVRRAQPASAKIQARQKEEYRAYCAAWGLSRPYLEAAWEKATGVSLLNEEAA